MNRWSVVVGGISMNLALGSLYAWSVFVLPLEEEFGWSRAETSWIFTIAVVCFALSVVVAGRIQDVRGPRICAATGAVMVGVGFGLASFEENDTGVRIGDWSLARSDADRGDGRSRRDRFRVR